MDRVCDKCEHLRVSPDQTTETCVKSTLSRDYTDKRLRGEVLTCSLFKSL